jgi:hypothetical protein
MRLKFLNFPNFFATKQGNFLISQDNITNALSLIAGDLGVLSKFITSTFLVLDPVSGLPDTSAYGLTGASLLAYSNTGNGGLGSINPSLYNLSASRPMTIYEALSALTNAVDPTVNATNVASQILNIKNVVGSHLFDNLQTSTSTSVDILIQNVTNNLNQLAADVYNINLSIGSSLINTYIFNQNGQQSKSLTINARVTTLEANTINFLTSTNVFQKNQSVTPINNNSVSGTITPNAALTNNFNYTILGNTVIANPDGLTDGMILNFYIKMGGAGSYTVTFGSKYKFTTVPTISTTTNSKDFMSCYYVASDDVLMSDYRYGYV